jgi:hypothetical protein
VAHAETLFLARGLHLRLADAEDSDSLADGVEDLQFITRFSTGHALILLDHRRKVSSAKTVIRDVLS